MQKCMHNHPFIQRHKNYKVVATHALKDYIGSINAAPPILKFVTRWTLVYTLASMHQGTPCTPLIGW